MEDIWHTFPAQMGDNQAWISFNNGFAQVAEEDQRNVHLGIRVKIRNPTEHGMPTNEEFPQLSALDEMLDDAITHKGGVYVGRVTVNGFRYFHFYHDLPEGEVTEIIEEASNNSGYKLQYILEVDKEKKNYWEGLYPTADDWQVINDLRVLDVLDDDGDNRDVEREVLHWAYFPSQSNAEKFKQWINDNNYKLIQFGYDERGDEYVVQYSHFGTMNLADITHHTISSNRKANELDGNYDGWETSVEKGE